MKYDYISVSEINNKINNIDSKLNALDEEKKAIEEKIESYNNKIIKVREEKKSYAKTEIKEIIEPKYYSNKIPVVYYLLSFFSFIVSSLISYMKDDADWLLFFIMFLVVFVVSTLTVFLLNRKPTKVKRIISIVLMSITLPFFIITSSLVFLDLYMICEMPKFALYIQFISYLTIPVLTFLSVFFINKKINLLYNGLLLFNYLIFYGPLIYKIIEMLGGSVYGI